MKIASLALIALALVGCSSSETGGGGSTSPAPKTSVDLPKDMAAPDRERAESALGAAQAQQNAANDPARVRAMQEMKKQHGG